MALSPTLQIRHMIALRSSAGISIPYLGVLVIGFVLWFAYGVALGNLAIIIPNTIAFVVGATTIAVARHYRQEDSGSAENGAAVQSVANANDDVIERRSGAGHCSEHHPEAVR